MNEKEVAKNKNLIRGRTSKILFLDEEVTPGQAWFYDQKGPVLEIIAPPYLVSYAWQWQGEKTIHVKALCDYPDYKPGRENLNDLSLAKDMYELMQEADVIIGHNAKDFDLKVARSRFLAHGFQPLPNIKVEDTLKMLWKYFRLPRNTLDYASKYVGLSGKGKQKHSDFIMGCVAGNMRDWAGMKKYNKFDIVLTKAFYEKISPWHENAYNVNLIERKGQRCKICLLNGRRGDNFMRKGYSHERTVMRQKYKCGVCGHIWRGETVGRAEPRLLPDTATERVEQFNNN